MLVSAPSRRALLATVIVGAVITAALWGGVQASVERSVAAHSAAASGTRPSSAEVAEREAIGPAAARSAAQSAARAAAQSAGRVVLLIGGLSTLVVGVMVAAVMIRRQKWNTALAARIESLNLTISDAEDAKAPLGLQRPGPVPSSERLIRRLAEAQATIQRRLTKLDSERRRGFEVLEHMTDGVVAVDADRRVLLLNPAARRLLRLTRESSFGRRLAEVVRVPQIVAAVDAVLSGESPHDSELDFRSDGDRFLKVHAIPLAVQGASGVLITIRDESQMRQLERMRREFIANVSHELKTPLAAIKGYAETLQLGAKEDPETCTHFLTQVGLQVERLERLINDMLQLARAQAGSQNLALANVPLAPVLRESITTYEPLARAREITLRYIPPSAAATVIADREALLTIANNLLGNAVRYTPEGGHVELRCDDLGEAWAIVVADDGLGIPVPDQERIFERFYRVEKARDASRGGTGLGLSIVKNLVQALGGEIHLHSRPGEGSVFEVRLPTASSQCHGGNSSPSPPGG